MSDEQGQPEALESALSRYKYGVFGDRIMILANSIFYSFMGVYKPYAPKS